MGMRKWTSLLAFLVICYAVEVIGGLFTSSSVHSWYPTLAKPGWNPPAWVFAPVWTLLYTMIAFAGWLIYLLPKTPLRSGALTIYGIQLFLNLIWSGVFFGLQSPLMGLIEILILWGMIAVNITLFWILRRLAGLLLLPYILWVSYAVTLTAAIWVYNRA